MQTHRGSNPRVDAQRLRRIEFLDVDRRVSLADREVDRLSRLDIQIMQIGKAKSSNIELPERGLPQRKARNAQVVNAGPAAIQVSRALQVHQEAMHRTDR